VILEGAFVNPGVYTFKNGEKLADLLQRVGGYSKNAYIDAGIFLRTEVRDREKKALESAADALEDSLVSALTSGQLSEISDPQLALTIMGQFLERLRNAEPLGRIVTEFNLDKIKKIPELNFEIKDGDKIIMPEQKSSITVTGEILSPMTFTYLESLDIDDYISLAGGYSENANDDGTFMILPNGQSIKYQNGWFGSKNFISPGTTIVVTRDTTKLSQITLWKAILPIFSNLVQTLAAIDALSD
jgi:polysaccharide export outer membrane protein